MDSHGLAWTWREENSQFEWKEGEARTHTDLHDLHGPTQKWRGENSKFEIRNPKQIPMREIRIGRWNTWTHGLAGNKALLDAKRRLSARSRAGSPRRAGVSPRGDEGDRNHRLKPVANLPPAQAGLKRWLGGGRGGVGNGMAWTHGLAWTDLDLHGHGGRRFEIRNKSQ